MYAFNWEMRNKNWNTAKQSTCFFLSQSFSLHFFPVEFTEFTPFPDFPLYKTLLSRLCHVAGPRSVNLSLPHSQAFVSDSRTQGWHCRGRVAEGLRREGGRRRGKLACTVFLAGGDRMSMNLRDRSRCGWNRACDARWGAVLSSVVSVPEPKGRKRKESWMMPPSTVVQATTMATASSSSSRAGSNSDNGGDGSSGDGGGSDGSDGGGYTPCAVPALNYWDTTRSMSQKENGCAAWNDGLSRRSYIMHAAASARWPAHVYSCANVKKKLPTLSRRVCHRVESRVSSEFLVRLCRVIACKVKKVKDVRRRYWGQDLRWKVSAFVSFNAHSQV